MRNEERNRDTGCDLPPGDDRTACWLKYAPHINHFSLRTLQADGNQVGKEQNEKDLGASRLVHVRPAAPPSLRHLFILCSSHSAVGSSSLCLKCSHVGVIIFHCFIRAIKYHLILPEQTIAFFNEMFLFQ